MKPRHIRHIVLILLFGAMMGLVSPVGVAAAQVTPNDDPGSPVGDANRAKAVALFEVVFNGGDAIAAEALISADAVIHTPYGDFTGPDGLSDYLDFVHSRYPDASFHVVSIAVQPDGVVVRWTMTASRYQANPYVPTVDVDLRVPGETAITVSEGQIARVIHTEQATANATSQQAAYEPLPGQPF